MDLFDLFCVISIKDEYLDGINTAGKSVSTFADKVKTGLATAAKVGAAALGAATAAATAFAKASIDTGAVFDSSMSQVAATMGTTVDQIAELRDFAMEMGAKTAFSASQAADALNYMALAGYDADQSMQALPNVLNLAAAGCIDLAAASDMVTDAQSALGLSMEESAELVDKMAMASSKSNTSVAQLGEAILTIGGTAKNLAGGTTELSTALGILADNGIKGAEGGTHLRNVILSLTSPTDSAAAALAQLGVEVYDAEGNMRPLNDTLGDLQSAMSSMTQGEQTNIIGALFNKTDIAAVNALLSNVSYNMEGIKSDVESAGIAWEKYADSTWYANSGLNGLIDEILYNIDEIGTSADDLQKYLQFEYDIEAEDALQLIETINSSLADNGNRWYELSGYIDDAAGAAQAMADTQLDNLNGDITLFKSALEGAQIVLSDKLTPTIREFVQFGSEAISTLSTAFQEGGLSGAMEALGTILSEGLNMVIAELPNMVEAGMQLLNALGQGLIDNIPVIIDAALEIITMLANGIIESLPEIATAAIEIIFTLASGIAEALPELIPTIVDVVLQIVETLIDNADMLIDAAIEIIIALAEGIVNALPTLIEKAPVIITKLVEAIVTNVPKLLEAALQIIVMLAKGVVENIPKLLEAIPQVITSIVQGFASFMSSITEIGKKIVTAVGDGIKGLASNALTWGKDLIDNFISGIKAKISAVKDAVSGIASTVKNFLGFSEPEEGPLSNFHTYAPDMMKLFSEGIEDNAGLIKSAFNDSLDFGTATVDFASSGIGKSSNALRSAFSELTASMSQSATIVVQSVLDGKAIGEASYQYARNKERAMG